MHTISGYILKHAWCLPHAVNVQDTIGIIIMLWVLIKACNVCRSSDNAVLKKTASLNYITSTTPSESTVPPTYNYYTLHSLYKLWQH